MAEHFVSSFGVNHHSVRVPGNGVFNIVGIIEQEGHD
jgi:hypothetical protein